MGIAAMKQSRVESTPCAICGKPILGATKNQRAHPGECKRELKMRYLRDLRASKANKAERRREYVIETGKALEGE